MGRGRAGRGVHGQAPRPPDPSRPASAPGLRARRRRGPAVPGWRRAPTRPSASAAGPATLTVAAAADVPVAAAIDGPAAEEGRRPADRRRRRRAADVSLARASHCSSACSTAARSSAAGTGYFSTAIAPSRSASLARSGCSRGNSRTTGTSRCLRRTYVSSSSASPSPGSTPARTRSMFSRSIRRTAIRSLAASSMMCPSDFSIEVSRASPAGSG